MKRTFFAVIALILVLGAAVGAVAMRADTSAANGRVESRPTFIYRCSSCHG